MIEIFGLTEHFGWEKIRPYQLSQPFSRSQSTPGTLQTKCNDKVATGGFRAIEDFDGETDCLETIGNTAVGAFD